MSLFPAMIQCIGIMGLFLKSKWNGLAHFLTGLPGFSKPDKHSIHFLNVAQFMGVLNDNIFKLVIAFLIIEIQGKQHASFILSLAGLIYVGPFLLFSSTAGILADRFSKQRLLVAMKIAEIVIMSLAMLAFGMKSVWASYTLLFILSIHSAMFGPSKYAIIAELVPSEKVSRANGLITSFTYLGVIVGTFLASFVTDITGRNFVLVAAFCLLIAIIGFFSTFGIRVTPAQGSDKKMNAMFIREIFQTLKFCRTRKHLLVAITGSAYFLFIGAFTQLNIIPFAISCLDMSEIAGGYLFLATALGIALGSYIGGKASKTRVELGLSCLSGLFLAAILVLLAFCPADLFTVISLLVFLGVFGGLFIVPFDSFVQLFSPDEKRGQIIAANNFLAFGGVLLASISLFFYSQILDISPASGFAMMGILTLFLSLLMISRLSDLALPYISKAILKPFKNIKADGLDLIEKNPGCILVLKNASWKKAFLLMSVVPKTHLLIPKKGSSRFPWFNWMFYSIHLVPSNASYQPLITASEQLASEEVIPCLFVEENTLPEALQPSFKLSSLFKLGPRQFIFVSLEQVEGVATFSFKK